MKLNLNLASRRYLNRRALYGFYTVIIVVLILVLGLNLSLFFRGRSQARHLEARLAELEQQLSGQQGAAVKGFSLQAYADLLDEIGFANDILLKDSFRWTRLLDWLEEVTPKRVLVSSIQPEFKDHSLKIVGQARSVDDLRNFIDNLIESPHFTEVYLYNQAKVLSGGSSRGKGGNISYSIDLKGGF
jgi:type IV pilus assembly protein PilN